MDSSMFNGFGKTLKIIAAGVSFQGIMLLAYGYHQHEKTILICGLILQIPAALMWLIGS